MPTTQHTTWPILYSLSSTGKIKQWQVYIVEKLSGVIICSSHGYKDQVLTITISSVIKGKNIGKKNETTPLGQAILEAASKHQHRLDKNYSETIPTSVDEFENLRPMLAHKYSERSHDIVFPAYIQPKLDGCRALAKTHPDYLDVVITSRGAKQYYTLGHITSALLSLEYAPTAPFDGEIFHPDMALQDINAAVKKVNDDTASLQYWIYDIAEPRMPYESRMELLRSIRGELPENSPIHIVETILVHNEDELMAQHKIWALTYEGTMVRNRLGTYVYDYRSADLQKIKDFDDAEFKIIGYKSASGADEGTVVWKCRGPMGGEFDVRPRGTRDQRREWFDNAESHLGSNLTVRYQGLSNSGIPIFPVGVTLREEGT